jgi:hypothetical protein
VLVGLDGDAAVREMAARAPLGATEATATERAANLRLIGPGAAERISATLAAGVSAVR